MNKLLNVIQVNVTAGSQSQLSHDIFLTFILIKSLLAQISLCESKKILNSLNKSVNLNSRLECTSRRLPKKIHILLVLVS